MAIKKPGAKKPGAKKPATKTETSQRPEKFGSGMLVENENKTKDNQPDYRGWGTVDGQDVWISGWLKKSAKGEFISIAFEERQPMENG